jgi:hypothetical protein
MSILIDVFDKLNSTNKCEHDGRWYIAKPCDFKPHIKIRIKDAFRVLTGKSRAYHFKEDE